LKRKFQRKVFLCFISRERAILPAAQKKSQIHLFLSEFQVNEGNFLGVLFKV